MSAGIQKSTGLSSSATDPLLDPEIYSGLGSLAKYGVPAVIIGSEWHFKPAGVMEVEKRFAEKRDKMNAQGSIQWCNQDHYFQLSSERHLLPLLEELNRITKEIIVEEGGDREPDYEDDDSDDTYSELSTEFQSNLITKVAHYEPLQHTRVPNSDTDDVFYPDNIMKYTYRDIWNYSEGYSMDITLKSTTIQELEAMTASKIVKSPSESKVYIGSNKRGSVDIVITKLDNIAKYSLTSTSFYHIFYTEETAPCKFAIKMFPEVKKKYLETTLLEQTIHPQYVCERLTVRACPWNSPRVGYFLTKVGKYTAAVPSPGAQVAATKLWAGFFWKSRGEPADDPEKYFPNGYAKEIEKRELQEDQLKDEDVSSMPVDIAGWVANASTTADPSQKQDIDEWMGVTDKSINPLARLAMASEPSMRTPNGQPDNEAWESVVQKEPMTNLSSFSTSITPDDQPNYEEGKSIVRREPMTNLDNIFTPIVRNDQENDEERKSFCQQESATDLSTFFTPIQNSNVTSAAKQNMSEEMPFADDGNHRRNNMQSSLLDSDIDAGFISSDPNSDWNVLRNNAPETALIDFSSSPTRSPNLGIFDSSDNSNAWDTLEPMSLEPLASLMSLGSLEHSELPSEELRDLMNTASASILDSKIHLGNGELNLADFPALPVSSGRSSLKPSLKSTNAWPTLSPSQSAAASKLSKTTGNQIPQPRRQLGSEMSTRVFHKTMSQKAPAKKKGELAPTSITEPQEPFLEEMREIFGALMAQVRGFRGQVRARLDFGKILLGNLPVRIVSKGDNCKSWDADFIIRNLCPPADIDIRLGDGPELFFTNILSTLEADTVFLTNLKSKNGARLWSEKSTDWKVTYDITCAESRTCKLFTIEIDAETFETHIVVLRKFGEIDVHGTMRHWDLKLAVEGIEDEEEIRNGWPGYDDLAKEIQRTLYIPPGNMKPNHSFKIPKQMANDFIVYSFKIRKTRTYDSLDKKSKLHITEVDKSCGHELLVKNQEIVVYYFPEEKRDSKMKTRWHEASITSVTMDNLLQQNVNLGLGEEVSWTITDLVKKRVSNTFIEPACVMLAQMDGVGFYNDVQDLKG